MSDIVNARERLRQIALKLKAAGQKDLADDVESAIGMMKRRRAVRRMPVHSAKVTPAVRAKIIDLANTTKLDNAEIAAQVGVNPGRVSEVLHGDR